MSDEVVQRFRGLPSSERFDALKKLIFALTTDERKFVTSSISQTNDPLYVLPVELVLQIFSHLSLFDVWNLQSVCKRWRKTLSSDDFLRSAITRWHTEDPSDSASNGNLNSPIASRVRHMRAVKLGIPLSEKLFDNTGTGLQGPQPKLSQRRFDFKGRRIAYISSHQGRDDAVVVRDLVNGDVKVLRGEARERILLVVLTTALAGFVTFDGSLYVWRFPCEGLPDEVQRIQLPSSAIQAAGGDEHTIALVTDGRSNLPPSDFVIVYNAESGSTQQHSLMNHIDTDIFDNIRPLHSCLVLVDTKRDMINVFSLALQITPRRGHHGRNRQSKSLEIRKFDLALSPSPPRTNYAVHYLPLNFETSVRDFQFLMVPICPTGRKDEYRITICEVPFMGGLPFRLFASVRFDAARGRFSPLELPDRRSRVVLGAEEEDSVKRAMNVLWKDQFHRPRIDAKYWFEYVFYMNDSFMVSLEVSKLLTQHSRIRVMCFEPGVEMEDGGGDSKRNETERMEWLVE